MKKIAKKTSIALALVSCAAIAVPTLGQVGILAETVGASTKGSYHVVANSVQITGFKSTGSVGNEYTFKGIKAIAADAVANITALSIVVKEPNGTAVAVKDAEGTESTEGTTIDLSLAEGVTQASFTPEVAGNYTVTFSAVSGTVTSTFDYIIAVEATSTTYTVATPVNSANVVPTIAPTKTGSNATVVKFPGTSEIVVKDAKGNIIEDLDEADLKIVATASSDKVETPTFVAGENECTLTLAETDGAKYTVKYELRNKNDKLISYITMSTTAKQDYSAPEYTYSYSSSKPETAEIGVEKVLPSVVASAKTDASSVNVHYTVSITKDGTAIPEDYLKINDDGQYVFTPYAQGNYVVNYTIKDFFGKAPSVESTSFTIADVTDNTAPTTIVTMPYQKTTTEKGNITELDALEGFSEVQTDADIMILPIYAKDNANGYVDNNLTLYRQIINTSTKEVVFDESKYQTETNQYANKALIFNGSGSLAKRAVYINGQTKYIEATDAEQQVVPTATAELKDNTTYTVKYIAKDKLSGKSEVTLSVSLKIDNDFDAGKVTTAPTVKFASSEALPDYMNLGDEETFKAPTATQATDGVYSHSHLSTYVEYQLMNGDTPVGDAVRVTEKTEWVKVNSDKTEYSITVPEKITIVGNNITAVKIIAKSMNDLGKVGQVEKTINIVGTGDTSPTTIQSYSEWLPDPAQPTEKQSYEVGQKLMLPTVTYQDTMPKNVGLDVAISYSYEDEDTGNIITVPYAYEAQDFDYTFTTDAVTFANGYFVPEKVGVYDVVYTSTDAGDNKTTIAFQFDVVSSSIVNPGFKNYEEFTKTVEIGETVKFPAVELDNAYTDRLESTDLFVKVTGNTGFKTDNLSYATFTKVGTYKVQYIGTFTVKTECTFEGEQYTEGDVITIKSSTSEITVQATKGPEVANADEMKNAFFELTKNGSLDKDSVIKFGNTTPSEDGEYVLPLPQMKGNIDWAKSKLVVSSANTVSKTYNLDADGLTKLKTEGVTLTKDDVYSFTFTMYDVNGNATTLDVYTVDVGKVQAPTITVKDGALKSQYALGSVITVDMSKISAKDEGVELITKVDGKYQIAEDNKITITLKNKTTSETFKSTVAYDRTNLVFQFKDLTAGEYVMNVEVTGDTNKTATDTTVTFTVTNTPSNPLSGEEILGIVLIVVSVLVLGGVVTYFVVTRKKYKNKI